MEYWCSEACQNRWNAALTMPTPEPGYHPGGWVNPPALAPLTEVDLAPFQEAMNRAVRVLAEVTQLPADLLDPGQPAQRFQRIATEGDQFTMDNLGARFVPREPLAPYFHGELSATYPQVASTSPLVAQSGVRGWWRRLLRRKRRTP